MSRQQTNLGRPRTPLFIFRPARFIEAAQAFIQVEASSGIVLVLAALLALAWANYPSDASYETVWHTEIAFSAGSLGIETDFRHAVNDGLMTVFFFVVGLEIKRELRHGQLSSRRRALLPAAAALGGMIVPAAFYVGLNLGGETNGWAIPMATDIAFAVGVLSLLGRRIPLALKVFLLALAIVDDIGAIVVIAVFYASDLEPMALGLAGLLLFAVMMMNRAGVRSTGIYTMLGFLLWLAVFESGMHATLAGVLLGLLTPSSSYYKTDDFVGSAQKVIDDISAQIGAETEEDIRDGLAQLADLAQHTEAPLERLERVLHPWVSYGIVPLFALANAGVTISGGRALDAVTNPVSQGVFLGLLIGKPIGIVLFTWLAVHFRLCEMPHGADMRHILGVGCLGGIGFTVSLLITDLAFTGEASVSTAKLAILAASVVAGMLGFSVLRLSTNERGLGPK